MAQQKSIIQLKGRIGNISFYKTKDGFAARSASGVDGNKVKTHPSYARTRENMAEFQEAMTCVKTFRLGFADSIKAIADGTITTRLSSLFNKLVRQDSENARGSRRLLPGATAALSGLEFNRAASMDSVLRIPFTSVIDRGAGNLSVEVPAFSPAELVLKPEGATHFILTATAAALDFAGQKYVSSTSQSAPIPVDAVSQETVSLVTSIPGSTHPLFLAFGISFLQIINGIRYALKSGQFAAMRIVGVDTGVVG